MIVIEDKIQNIKVQEDLCIALGTFDGIHIGHQKLIKEAVSVAKSKKIKSAVFTFNKHPFNVLKPKHNIKIITDNKTKIQIFKSLGVDYVFFIDFDIEFANMERDDFLNCLHNQFNVKSIICGYNFTFGRLGTGNVDFLRKCQNIYEYDLKVIEKVTYNNTIISSSKIRKKIEEGNIEEANIMLGYNLFFYGAVIEGKHLGNKLGFPTTNTDIPANLCLRNGVYITQTYIDKKKYPSISNIGFAPTLDGKKRILETHILNVCENLYNSFIKIEFLKFLRDEVKFNNITELKNKVYDDIYTAKKYFELDNSCLH
ncbi:MAG: bifunctional riboflavin kinase/FAD synthetase [Caloramator sp.]|nr:bifunctional riboflavin kinase/FAD synthetase [Caloramator sp.]